MKPAKALVFFVVAVLLTGCGARVEANHRGSGHGFPLTVTNCGKRVTYQHMPQRVVTNEIGITELMLALGLGDKLAGYTMQNKKDVATSPWRQQFAQTRKLGKQLDVETARAANADLVFAGWNYGFTEASGVTPDSLAKVGIDSYLLSESCRSGHGRGTMPPLKALYTDIANLGELFNVQDRAKRLVTQYRAKIAKAVESIPTHRKHPTVFLYDSGTDAPLSVGRFAAADQIIEKAGGRNLFGDRDDTWVRFGWEPVAKRNPDVVLINDYHSSPPSTVAGKKRFLLGLNSLANTDAIGHHRFFALPYAALVEGPRNPDAIAKFTRYLNKHFPPNR